MSATTGSIVLTIVLAAVGGAVAYQAQKSALANVLYGVAGAVVAVVAVYCLILARFLPLVSRPYHWQVETERRFADLDTHTIIRLRSNQLHVVEDVACIVRDPDGNATTYRPYGATTAVIRIDTGPEISFPGEGGWPMPGRHRVKWTAQRPGKRKTMTLRRGRWSVADRDDDSNSVRIERAWRAEVCERRKARRAAIEQELDDVKALSAAYEQVREAEREISVSSDHNLEIRELEARDPGSAAAWYATMDERRRRALEWRSDAQRLVDQWRQKLDLDENAAWNRRFELEAELGQLCD